MYRDLKRLTRGENLRYTSLTIKQKISNAMVIEKTRRVVITYLDLELGAGDYKG